MSEKDVLRYTAALHAIQSGVAYDMKAGQDASGTSPRHLRVGVNSAMVQNAALVKLLIDKGVFSLDEFDKALADEMEEEKRRYEKKLEALAGMRVNLG